MIAAKFFSYMLNAKFYAEFQINSFQNKKD